VIACSDVADVDEPSSALAPRAEDALFQAIRGRQGDKTTILVTHRLANVRHADRIFVLNHGRVAELGGHDDLMAADASTPSCSACRPAATQAGLIATDATHRETKWSAERGCCGRSYGVGAAQTLTNRSAASDSTSLR
jgi:ATP-binding cassette subfamily B protein